MRHQSIRTHLWPVIGLATTAIIATVAFAPIAGAAGSPSASGASAAQPSRGHGDLLATCYSQLDDDNGIGIVSQNFERAYDDFDSRGADDFRLTTPCTVRQINVAGQYINGSGPARSENVTIYHSLHGLPAGVVSNQENIVGVDDGAGNIRIPLPASVGLEANTTYIVSVQVNMSFSTSGEWGWGTNDTRRGFGASWRNNFDGFGTGCTHFTRLLSCIDSNEGPDFAFSVTGVQH